MTSTLNVARIFDQAIADHLEVVTQLYQMRPHLQSIAETMCACLHAGGKILWCGNGGSAADAQHLAAELVGRFRRERRGLASVALTTDTSILTSIGNDYGYEAIFSRQIEALGRPQDLLVGFSTSGNSPNVAQALTKARALGMHTVAFTGIGGGMMAKLADNLFAVPSNDTARIQEVHILAGHMLCDWIELDILALATTQEAT